MSGQREDCKTFLAVYRLRLNQNLSDEMAWASAASTTRREVSLGDAEREEAEA